VCILAITGICACAYWLVGRAWPGRAIAATASIGPVCEMPQYIINLDRRTDRMAVTVPKLRAFGFTRAERWPATDSRLMSRTDVDLLVRPEARAPIWSNQRTQHHELSIGAVGCYLSHIRIWDAAARTTSYAVIFEDDTDPTITSAQLDSVLSGLPHDWDIVFLGIFGDSRDASKALSIQRVTRFYGMHAYIINAKRVSSLIKRALPMDMQIDSWLSKLAVEGSVNLYTIANGGWGQNDAIRATDVQSPVTLAS
jgi:GR25 family glycosyltransferase involved in LPS biosynthesis